MPPAALASLITSCIPFLPGIAEEGLRVGKRSGVPILMSAKAGEAARLASPSAAIKSVLIMFSFHAASE
jgi:hypothetical protein